MKNFLPVLSLLMFACQVKPHPIDYGTDACHFCKMTIVDDQHAAEIVTRKGRAYKYDAIECMLNDLKEWNRPPVQYYLINDYAQPGELVDATTAHYLVSERIPSPMGEFLSAFQQQDMLKKTHREVGGDTFDWTQLKGRFEVSIK